MLRSASITLLLIVSVAAQSLAAATDTPAATYSPASKHRQLVDMPEQARDLIRDDMLDHLSALNEIIGLLGENKLEAAAAVAESRMGKSSMGKHRGTGMGMGMGPGRFMTPEMRSLGHGMHAAATEFAEVAKKGDVKNAYAALQNITSGCVGCHYSFRIR